MEREWMGCCLPLVMGELNGVLFVTAGLIHDHPALGGLPIPACLHGIDTVWFTHRDSKGESLIIVLKRTASAPWGEMLLDGKGQRMCTHRDILKGGSAFGFAYRVHGLDVVLDQHIHVSRQRRHIAFVTFGDPGSVIVCHRILTINSREGKG